MAEPLQIYLEGSGDIDACLVDGCDSLYLLRVDSAPWQRGHLLWFWPRVISSAGRAFGKIFPNFPPAPEEPVPLVECKQGGARAPYMLVHLNVVVPHND